MTRATDKQAARETVLHDLRAEVKRRESIVLQHDRGAVGDAYRREIRRLWRVALRAVKQAIAEATA